MDGYLRRRQLAVAMRFLNGQGENGQASVEYAALTVALIVVVVACGTLWRFGSEGGFSRTAQQHASHAADAEGGLVDALLY